MPHNSRLLHEPAGLALAGRAAESLQKHETIVDAIRRRDPNDDEIAARAHRRTAQKTRKPRLLS